MIVRLRRDFKNSTIGQQFSFPGWHLHRVSLGFAEFDCLVEETFSYTLRSMMSWTQTTFFLIASVMATGSHALAQQADAIYYNGSILTMAGATPSYVEALAVKGGKIAFAGGKESAMQIKSDATKLIDLGGKALRHPVNVSIPPSPMLTRPPTFDQPCLLGSVSLCVASVPCRH